MVGSALRISEATSLAMHTMALLGSGSGPEVSSREIAGSLGVSQAHLQKVLQRLGRAGLVHSERGPRGGFTLAQPPERITLLEVYEAIEGPLHLVDCLFSKPACRGGRCILGGLVGLVNDQFGTYLRETTLADLAGSAPAAGRKKAEGDRHADAA